jgi:hypothetical protein
MSASIRPRSRSGGLVYRIAAALSLSTEPKFCPSTSGSASRSPGPPDEGVVQRDVAVRVVRP